MNDQAETHAMSDEDVWPPLPGPEEIELGMEELRHAPPKRKIEEAIVAYEKRRAFLIRDSKEIAAIEAQTPAHAETLAQQLAENRANLAETERRLAWLRFQLESKN